jgi:NADH-quinone oxidoreductase subunit E
VETRVLTPGSAEQQKQIERIVSQYRGFAGPLIQVLHKAQGVFGYLSDDVLRTVARELELPESEVRGVATFYNFFRLDPVGKHTVSVCLGTACYVKGGAEILKRIKRELRVEEGRTTEDGLFTLETARCFGACGLAPVMMVDEEVYGRLSPTKAMQILQEYREADQTSEEKQ